MALLEHFNIVHRKPRSASSIGLFSAYDANIIGGALLGFGMALTGACPGTVLVQLALGFKSSGYTLLGAVIGGILYARYGDALKASPLSKAKAGVKGTETLTIQGKLDVNANYVLLGYEVLCAAVITIANLIGAEADSKSVWYPIAAGALGIGGAQGVNLLLTGNAVGVSGAYEEIGRHFWYALDSKSGVQRPSSRAIAFASGILVGTLILAKAILPIHGSDTVDEGIEISVWRALFGGLILVFGSRIAGGCTSGHGISGMSMFSISSIITVAAMFGGGIAAAMLVA